MNRESEMDSSSVDAIPVWVRLEAPFEIAGIRKKLHGHGVSDAVAELVVVAEIRIVDFGWLDHKRFKQIPEDVVEFVLGAVDRLVKLFLGRIPEELVIVAVHG